MYQKKNKTSKIDLQVNADLAKLECQKQRERYRKIVTPKVGRLVDDINRDFARKMNNVCPVCGGKLYRHTKTAKGFVRFRCPQCSKVYNANQNTIFHNCNLDLWKIFSIVDNIGNNSTIRLTAFSTGFSVPTSYKRRKQILSMFPDASVGKVWGREVIVDETYYESREHNLLTRFDRNHQRIKKRGTSADKACVYAATTAHGNHIAIKVLGDGKPSNDRTDEALAQIIDINRTKLVQSDGDKTYENFCRKHNLEFKSEKKNPAMVWINAVHSKMKNFTNQFWGIRKSQLQLYMNWFAYTYKWTYVGLAEKLKQLHSLFINHFIKFQPNC